MPLASSTFLKASLKPIERKAAGQPNIQLGGFYDAASDTVVPYNLFKELLPDEHVNITEVGGSFTDYFESNTQQQQFDSLDISAELSLTIMCLPLSISGSAKYMQENRSSNKTQRKSLIYEIQTTDTSITPQHCKEYIDLDILQDVIENKTATHVITTIEWGGRCIIDVAASTTKTHDEKKIGGMLQASMQLVAFKISGEASVDIDEMKDVDP